MRILFTSALVLSFTVPPVLAGQAVLRAHDPYEVGWSMERPTQPSRVAAGVVAERVDEPAETLFVPFFEIDTTSPGGTTTLFAVRNISPHSIDFEVRYLSEDDDLLDEESVRVDVGETLTRNVRDVEGLEADPDGFARGYVEVQGQNAPRGSPGIDVVGDYLQVDVDDSFATGERMVSSDDFCEEQEVRFLDFGSGTELRFMIQNPRGLDFGTDPPSARVRVVAEDGTVLSDGGEIYTDSNPRSEVSTSKSALRAGSDRSKFFGVSHLGNLVSAVRREKLHTRIERSEVDGVYAVGVGSAHGGRELLHT